MVSTVDFAELLAAAADRTPISSRVIKKYPRGTLISIGGHLALLRGTASAKAGSYQIGDEIEVYILSADAHTRKVFVTDIPDFNNLKSMTHDERFERYGHTIKIGQRYRATIIHIVDYGVFAAVNNAPAFLHTRELSWSRKRLTLTRQFHVGQTINVIAIDINHAKKRIELSLKQALPDPFLVIPSLFEKNPERIYSSQITNIVDYGIFVEVIPGVEGLLHASQFAIGGTRVGKLTENIKALLKRATRVPVQISGIKLPNRRISLTYCGIEIEAASFDKIPSNGELLEGTVSSIDEKRGIAKISGIENAELHQEDDPDGFLDLTLRTDTINRPNFLALGIDLSSGVLRLSLSEQHSAPLSDSYTFILENFLAGQSNLDQSATHTIPNPYLVLARQLEHLKGERLHKTFDYIYHFGIISGDDRIRIFGLIHRASIEFKRHRKELGLALLESALKDALDLRSQRLTQTIIRIVSRNAPSIWW